VNFVVQSWTEQLDTLLTGGGGRRLGHMCLKVKRERSTATEYKALCQVTLVKNAKKRTYKYKNYN